MDEAEGRERDVHLDVQGCHSADRLPRHLSINFSRYSLLYPRLPSRHHEYTQLCYNAQG